ncbi:sporulation protein YqfD [Amedibacillus sp. YH-ame10]
MRNKQKIGLDEWRADISIQEFLQIVKRNELEVYDLHVHHEYIEFYSEVWLRYRIQHSFSKIERVRTTGMLGYAMRSLRKPARVLSIIVALGIWFFLSNTIFAIDIKGEQEESRTLIQKTLKDMGYTTPIYHVDGTKMKQELKKRLENEIAWLEVSKQGSRYLIHYTPKEFASISQLKKDELIAREDGVIARFEISHGNKVHKVNDFVHAGDVLVSNVMDDSLGKKEELYVAGRVYAYTWKDVTVTMDQNGLPKSLQYFDLLLDARALVSKDFREGDSIYKENILQFSNDMGKIKMVIHYTLYKDITTP